MLRRCQVAELLAIWQMRQRRCFAAFTSVAKARLVVTYHCSIIGGGSSVLGIRSDWWKRVGGAGGIAMGSASCGFILFLDLFRDHNLKEGGREEGSDLE